MLLRLMMQTEMKCLLLSVAIALLVINESDAVEEVHPAWQYGKTLQESNRYMFENQLATDVSFKVGPAHGIQSVIGAHKYVLTSRSAVFEKLFYGQRNSTAPHIIINDVDPVVFREILSYMYTDTATITSQTVLKIMSAAMKYELPKLVGMCQIIAYSNITLDNVCDILDQALAFGEKQLINKSLALIGANAQKVFTTKEFLEISYPTLQAIVAYDYLNISESGILQASLLWAKHKVEANSSNSSSIESLRRKLGDIFYKIRFPTMKLVEFASLPYSDELFTCSEKEQIYYYIATRDTRNNSLLYDHDYRKVETYYDRFTSVVKNMWGCSGNYDAIKFKVDQNITVTAIGTFGVTQQTIRNRGYYGSHNINKVNYTLEVFKDDNVYGNSSMVLNTTDYNGYDIIKIPLKEPVQLSANDVYTIRLKQYDIPRVGCYSAYGQRSDSSSQVHITRYGNITFEFFTAGTSTTPTRGQIPRIYYVQI